jgi:hypothetical protein
MRTLPPLHASKLGSGQAAGGSVYGVSGVRAVGLVPAEGGHVHR